jgi:hypothetical protein
MGVCGALWIASLLLLCGCAGGGPGPGGAPPEPPRLAFDHTEYDFGRVPQGAVVAHDFPLTNRGGLPLAIVDLRSACDCQASTDAPAELPPGGTAAVRVDCGTDATHGPQRRTVTVYSNDPGRRSLVLALTGEVELDLVADPPHAWVGAVPRGGAVASGVALLAGPGTRIEGMETDGPYFSAVPTDLGDGREGRSFDLRVAAEAPLGPFVQEVRIRSSSERHPLLRVAVSGRVEEEITASPARLDFGEVPRGVAPTRLTLIENHGDEPVEIAGQEWEKRLGAAEVETVRQGYRYRVRVTLSDRLQAGAVGAALLLRTDSSSQPVIEIPVIARVADRAAPPEGSPAASPPDAASSS